MPIHKFMYLNLRQGIYNKSQREWLLQKAISCLDGRGVLEVHSHSSLMMHRTLSLRQGLSHIAFKDRPNHIVTQIYQSNLGHRTTASDGKDQAFYIDGRCIEGVQIARQAIHLLHKPQRFTPRLGRLVVWSKCTPRQLIDVLREESREFDVYDMPKVGCITTIAAQGTMLKAPPIALAQDS